MPRVQYTIMIHETQESLAVRTDPAHQAADWGGTLHYPQSLKDAGIVVGGAGLQPPHTATVLRYGTDGAPVVPDGLCLTSQAHTPARRDAKGCYVSLGRPAHGPVECTNDGPCRPAAAASRQARVHRSLPA
jgi:hypothetical protein